jgi:arginase
MIILNAQWQGSGFTNEIEIGAKLIGKFFWDSLDVEIELSNIELQESNGIIGYKPLYNQLKSFRKLVFKSNPESITTVGGDCGVEIIPVSYLNFLYNKIGIIWLDAHADLNTPQSSPSHFFHGMPLRLLLGEGDTRFKDLLFSTISPDQILYIGIRDTDESEINYIKEHEIFNTLEINYQKIKQKLDKTDLQKIYIHLDLDIIDPLQFKYTKCPTNNGLTINEIERLIRKLQKDFNIIGYGICESVAKDKTQLLPILKILKMIKKNTMHNIAYKL